LQTECELIERQHKDAERQIEINHELGFQAQEDLRQAEEALVPGICYYYLSILAIR
jgi:hypothetical protein